MSTAKFLKESILTYHTVPKTVISSLAGWSSTYFLIKKITGQEPEWTVRVVTALHATIITILAAVDWSYIRQWNIERLGRQNKLKLPSDYIRFIQKSKFMMRKHYNCCCVLCEANSKYEEIILCITLGYFLFDIVWILKYQTEGIAMYCHHAASILCLTLILGKGFSASEVLVGISGLELTNPCLQARWFLRNYGYHGTWIYTITEFAFMTTFIVFRIFYGTYLTYNIIKHQKCHLALKLGTLGLYAVSWAFAYQMFLYVSKRFRKCNKDK